MNRKSTGRGFSLLEVMVALFILAVGLLAVAKLQVAAINTLALSRHISTATQLAESQIEFLRTLPFDPYSENIPSLKGGGQVTSLCNGVGSPGSPFKDDQPTVGMKSSWHVWPNNGHILNELGQPARSGEMAYYVRWNVDRGALTTAEDYTTPGLQQVAIVMEVFWWELKKGNPEMSKNRRLTAAEVAADSDFKRAVKEKPYKVRLETVRQSDI